MTDKSRATFEAWYARRHSNANFRTLTDGQYAFLYIETSWISWQESRKQALEEAAQTCKETAEACVSVKRFNLLTDAGKAIYDAMSKGALNCESAIRGLI